MKVIKNGRESYSCFQLIRRCTTTGCIGRVPFAVWEKRVSMRAPEQVSLIFVLLDEVSRRLVRTARPAE